MSYDIAAVHILTYKSMVWLNSSLVFTTLVKKANTKSIEYILKWSISTNVLILQFRQGIIFLLIQY